ncbi:hypothetical protein WME94_10285 [Sorangium sp. So ce429]
MSRRALVTPLAALLTLPGCAAQLGGGAGMATLDRSPSATFTADGRLFAPRRSGPLLGVHLTGAVGQDHARPFRLRNAGFAAGYHVSTPRSFPFGIGGEGAVEVSVGAPLREEWDSLGAAFGVSATMLYRLWGPGDREPGFDTLTTLLDLALTARGAAWSAPEGTPNPTRGEGIVGLALRVTVSTDLSTSLPPESEESAPVHQTTTSPPEFQ